MTDDFMSEQAAIKARRKHRDSSGQFTNPSLAAQAKLAAERMRARLERDVKALEHSQGLVYEHGHYHALPGQPLRLVETVAPAFPLLDAVAA